MADETPNEPGDEASSVDRRSVLKYGGASAVTAGLAGCQSPENPVGICPRCVIEGPNGNGPGPGEGVLSGQTIRIGVLAPMNLPVGVSMWDAAQMAADKLNRNGGIMGANVEVELGNTKAAPGTAEAEHQRLVIEENCDMTCGIFLGSALLQTLGSISNQQKVHVTTGSAEPRAGLLASRTSALVEDDAEAEYEKYKYHFRAGPIHLLDLADALIEFLEIYKDDYDWDTAALLTENIGELTRYHEALQELLPDVIDVPLEYRPGGISDWSPIWNEIESADCDIALIGLALTGTTAVNQWHNQERQFEMGGIHVPAQAYEYWEGTDGRVEHVFTMNAMTPQTENTPLTQEFVQGYIDRYDRVPMYTGPLTHDAIVLMEQAIENCVNGEDIEEVPDADTLIPYIEETTFTGGTVIEEFQFTPPDAEYAHEPQWTSMQETGVPVYQQWQYDEEIRDDYGTMHSFAPEDNKTADKTVPDWI